MRHPRVLIIGAGLAGTATAIRLLQFARTPLEIVLLERRHDYRFAGVAYHRDGNPWDHVFNIQAGRMSAFREDVDDFLRWANHEADRSGWTPQWKDFTFVGQGPAPRRIYQDYLTDRVAEACSEAYPDVELVGVEGEATDLEIRADQVEVSIRSSTGDGTAPADALTADHVILATGMELKRPAFATAYVPGTPRAWRDRPPRPHNAVRAVPEPDGLPDPRRGRVEGRLRRGQRGPPRHRPADRPGTSGKGLGTVPAGDNRPDPHRRTASAAHRIQHADRLAAGRRGALHDVRRRGRHVVRPWSGRARRRRDRARHTGRIRAAERRGGDPDRPPHHPGRPRGVQFGREFDYTHVSSPLWTHLLTRRLVTPHERTGRGIETSNLGTPLRPDGEPVEMLSAIGVMREGDEIVRNGRTGAFAFNLAAIKNHSIVVAAHVIGRLQQPSDGTSPSQRGFTVDDANRAGFEQAVAPEVKRLAARSRSERERLDAQLTNHLSADHRFSAATADGGGRRLRAAINQAAIQKLTDISVTPRQLPRQLGISNDGEAEFP